MLTKIKKLKCVKEFVFSQYGRKLMQFLEVMIWGGRHRRKITKWLLLAQYQSKFRSNWVWAKDMPHFSDNEASEATFANPSNSAYLFMRGLLTAEILVAGDRLLDIGCGDGFYNYRFYSHKCEHIDAIDIEPSAIAYAKLNNNAQNISYVLQDAVNQAFPSPKYDVIAWDGAIGHFAPETTAKMLSKIVGALKDNGIFTGSESLGHDEGCDHLQFFETIEDFGRLFKNHFKYVYIREVSYPISKSSTFIRREAFWRCSNSDNLKSRFGWEEL